MRKNLENVRPCEVDGRPAAFLRWYEDVRVLLHVNCFVRPEAVYDLRRRFDETGLITPGLRAEAIPELLALVEWPDGCVGGIDLSQTTDLTACCVGKVKPELIRFLDTEGRE